MTDQNLTDQQLNTIHLGDCISGMNSLPAGSIDLAFADPPFNIGYKYDVYEDRMAAADYLSWSQQWISAVYRALKPDGTFWLAIGDDFAAELKVECRQAGFHCRSWVIWYYTFGVNCSRKFTRSHTHLFHFIKDPDNFTFREQEAVNRIPSARQLVYNDKRANSVGRLPDDTWIIPAANTNGEITAEVDNWLRHSLAPVRDNQQTFTLRPQDLAERFSADEDTWYFPRVAGTFKERAGFHGCQMPEQLLGRIIRTCSNNDDLVMDPFAGSASTLIVAKKLDRRFVGFELSEDYARAGLERLSETRIGDPLTGSAEPTMSAPRTTEDKSKHASKVAKAKKHATRSGLLFDEDVIEQDAIAVVRARVAAGVTSAFREIHLGHTEDRVIADPEFHGAFVDRCRKLGLPGDARSWNLLLLEQRHNGAHSGIAITQHDSPTLADCDRYLSAAEIAWCMLLHQDRAASLNEILCDPFLTADFDALAAQLAPGGASFHYRWAALQIAARAATARIRGAVLSPPAVFGTQCPLAELQRQQLPDGPGVFIVSASGQTLHVGETLNLKTRISQQFGEDSATSWQKLSEGCVLQTFQTQSQPDDLLAWASCLVTKLSPRYNIGLLHAASRQTTSE